MFLKIDTELNDKKTAATHSLSLKYRLESEDFFIKEIYISIFDWNAAQKKTKIIEWIDFSNNTIRTVTGRHRF